MKVHWTGSIVVFLLFPVLFGGCTVTRQTRLAAASYENGEYYQCITSYRKVYSKTKGKENKAAIQLKIAESLYRIGQYRQAESYFKGFVNKDPDDMTILLRYAEVLRANGKYEESIRNYRKFLNTNPGDERALNGIVSCNTGNELLKSKSLYII
jgi:tetratricopeptide (TPR) repeat protein